MKSLCGLKLVKSQCYKSIICLIGLFLERLGEITSYCNSYLCNGESEHVQGLHNYTVSY